MIRPAGCRGTRFFSTGNNGSARVGWPRNDTESTERENERIGARGLTRRHQDKKVFGGWRVSGGHGITRKTRKADCLVTTNHQPPTTNHQNQPLQKLRALRAFVVNPRAPGVRVTRPGHASGSRAQFTRPVHAPESVPNRPAGPIRLEIPVNPPQSLKSVPVGRKNRHAFWRTFEEAAAYRSRSAELALC